MKLYRILVQETLERVVEIEAETEEEAFDKVSEAYNQEEIVLDWQDCIDRNIEILED